METLPLNIVDPQLLLVPVAVLIAMIPMAKIWTRHQQRMAEILHGPGGQQASADIAQLQQEMAELKQLVHQQTIALDTLSSYQLRSREQPLQERLERIDV